LKWNISTSSQKNFDIANSRLSIGTTEVNSQHASKPVKEFSEVKFVSPQKSQQPESLNYILPAKSKQVGENPVNLSSGPLEEAKRGNIT
jgi:hypothetical protein